MDIPPLINARWIGTLADRQLVVAEAELYATFQEQESAEKVRRGARYVLFRGPLPLLDAWHRWTLVNNATFARGLVLRRRTKRKRRAVTGPQQ